MMRKLPVRRRICWPAPDEVCLQGGCGYCNDHRPVFIDAIMADARKRSPRHFEAFWTGLQNNFYNAIVEYHEVGK